MLSSKWQAVLVHAVCVTSVVMRFTSESESCYLTVRGLLSGTSVNDFVVIPRA